MYAEASSPRKQGDIARLISPQFMWRNVNNCTVSVIRLILACPYASGEFSRENHARDSRGFRRSRMDPKRRLIFSPRNMTGKSLMTIFKTLSSIVSPHTVKLLPVELRATNSRVATYQRRNQYMGEIISKRLIVKLFVLEYAKFWSSTRLRSKMRQVYILFSSDLMNWKKKTPEN